MEVDRISKYNDEDVFYCSHCLSLNIRYIDDIDYCEDCGSTDISTGSIFVWENLCKNKYGKPSWDKETGEE